jgi:hypothetical protein
MTPRKAFLASITVLFLFSGLGAQAAVTQEEPRSTGMKCFFVGHSFFCPVALSFDRIAKGNDFPEHDMKLVFRGGQAGIAGALWTLFKA